jgi:hypothetical protein
MIRKEYENGNPNNIRMKDIRDWTTKEDGISSTITTVELDRMIMECYILDDLYANREPRLYTECPTLRSERSGLKVIEEFPVCCAMRGRYNENGKIEQNLEVNSSDFANAITTVQKDCMILERSSQ